jgi:ZIP family zinc transporter
MDNLLKITLIGLISGITGTGIGGLTAFFVSGVNKRSLSFILEFAAGLMTSVVCFELIPEAFSYGGTILVFAGVFAGVLTIMAVEEFVRRFGAIKPQNEKTGLLKAGVLMAIGISLHNFPEGFAVGSGFGASLSLGIMMTTVIIIHDIPEGIAMAVPMRAGGFSKSKAFFITVLSGLPMGVGAFFIVNPGKHQITIRLLRGSDNPERIYIRIGAHVKVIINRLLNRGFVSIIVPINIHLSKLDLNIIGYINIITDGNVGIVLYHPQVFREGNLHILFRKSCKTNYYRFIRHIL